MRILVLKKSIYNNFIDHYYNMIYFIKEDKYYFRCLSCDECLDKYKVDKELFEYYPDGVIGYCK